MVDADKNGDGYAKAITAEQLKPIGQEESGFIFNSFLEILRHNVVSDKPNAFNKFFTLFLCKVYDEKTTKPNEELKFQWLDGKDDHVSFQIRLADLYKAGMKEFLGKEITDFSNDDFETEYKDMDSKIKESLLRKINKLRLEKNNEFAIKEVFDEASFRENAKIVKEVVELLQGFRLRYNKRQQYLSDFFELLLATGLKQEAGQFFTPIPIAQFIIKSLPIDELVGNNLFPYLIDYAAGSGHFLTESMREIQRIIDRKKPNDCISGTHFDWATQYIYGIEKDYRLVKVGKVGCSLHGNGLANVILSDGLASFDHSEYKGKLRHRDKNFHKENKQFDILISNPPYSVSAFKNNATEFYSKEDFELYDSLTDNSSEIECLFVERAKQLLKDGGMAGIILPSSILSNEGIYVKAREIILQYFEIIAITELGGNAFMATGTNTVVLFLRRRNNYDCRNIATYLENSLNTYRDNAINGIEKPIAEYINHVWKNIGFEDYAALLKKNPNNALANHEIYKEYRKKLKTKTEKDFWNMLIETEKEKLLYFILAYPQKIVLVKTGEKDAEKRFLGYEFSNRRGNEGIHPIQHGKSIEECTKLFNENHFEDETKASTYIHKAFNGDHDFPIHESLKNNISRARLVDMLIFDREIFAKNISTAIKKKVKIESKFPLVSIAEIINSIESGSRPKGGVSNITEGIYSLGGEHIDNKNGHLNLTAPKFVPLSFYENATKGKLQKNDVLICKDGTLTGKIAIVRNELDNMKAMVNEHVFILRCRSLETQKYLFHYLFSENGQMLLKSNIVGAAQGGLNSTNLRNIKIHLPPKEIQEKIVAEIEVLEKKEEKAKEKIEKGKEKIAETVNNISAENKWESTQLGNILFENDKSKIKVGTAKDLNTGRYPFFTSGENVLKFNEYLIDNQNIYLSTGGNAVVKFYDGKAAYSTDAFAVRSNDEKRVKTKFIFIFLESIISIINKFYFKGVGLKHLQKPDFRKIKIPLPPPSEQQKIISKVEKIKTQIAEAQKIIDKTAALKADALKKHLYGT